MRSSNGLDFGVFDEATVLKLPRNHEGTLSYEVSKPEDLHSILSGLPAGEALGHASNCQVLAANDFYAPRLNEPEHRFETGTVLFLPEVFKPFGFPIPLPGKSAFRPDLDAAAIRCWASRGRRKGIDIPSLTGPGTIFTFAN